MHPRLLRRSRLFLIHMRVSGGFVMSRLVRGVITEYGAFDLEMIRAGYLAVSLLEIWSVHFPRWTAK